VTGRECPWACGPPEVMKNLDRNGAVTGRERSPVGPLQARM